MRPRRRVPFRAEHLAGVRARLASGTYVEAGAFLGRQLASVVLVRAASEAEALGIVVATTCTCATASGWSSGRAPFGRVIRRRT